MKKIFYAFVLIAGVLVGSVLTARAASIFDITYPIAELENCASQAECKVYCDDLAHKDACLSFAEKYGLVAKEKVEAAKKFPVVGPGGCQSAEECRAYCDNPDNEAACLVFAEKYGMKTQGARGQEISARARLIKEQGGPGNCQSQKECRAYCENPAHQEECLVFAEKYNLMDKKEIKAAKKMMEQGGPGGCKDEKECRAYCDQPENMKVCLAFAEENELMPKEEIAKAKRLAGMPGPGGCLGRQCEEFCRKPDNRDICFQFAVENNLIPQEEIDRIQKMKNIMAQGGPGGCKDEKECRAYCENQEHSDECIEFAKKNHLIGEKDMKIMERGREMMKKAREAGGPGGCRGPEECRAYCEKPENVEACLAFAVEQGGMDVEEAKGMLEDFAQAGTGGIGDNFGRMEGASQGMMPPVSGFATSSNEHFKRFEQFRELEDQFRKSPEMMRDFQGPGGCKGPEECMKYCSDPEHRSECAKSNPSVGGLPPGEMFKQMEPGSEKDFRKYKDVPVGILQKCIEEGGTIEKSASSDIPKCFKGDGEEIRLIPNNMMQGGGEQRMPPPGMMYNRPDVTASSTGRIFDGQRREMEVCLQEYKPVCGANNRTYPNECFAKRDNVSVAKDGPCGATERSFNPPTDQYPQNYTQPPVFPGQQPLAPQSKRITESLFSNLLQAFSRALMLK